MGRQKIWAYTCDGCGKIVPDADGGPANGLSGRVQQFSDGSGSARVDWFACSMVCLQQAIVTVLESAWGC
jgi:hypothetical protein